jgi:anaerobic selenocysteine-containing dehydrogenase
LDGAGSRKYPFTKNLLNRFPAAIDSGGKYLLQALFVNGANPLYTMPDNKAFQKAFAKIPFVVSFSSYMDETAHNADLILPNHTYLERYEDIPTPTGLPKPVISLSRPVVEPQFNTKHVGDVIILIARAMGGSVADAFQWDSYDACLKKTLGDKWETLVAEGFWSDSQYEAPSWGSSFGTPSGKFQFVNSIIGSKLQFAPVNIEGEKNYYPLILIPYDSIRLANGFIGDPPFVIKTVEDIVLKEKDVFIEINPETAKALRMREGQRVILSTPQGQARVKIHWFEGIMPGVIAIPTGLGHTSNDDYLDGKGVNYNQLVGPVEDPVSGLDTAWGIRAKLTKA